MKIVVNNKDHLKEKDMTEVVKRVKVLLINSQNEILLGYSHNTYQFPGGHVEEGEAYEKNVVREVREETGIVINKSIPKPFAAAYGYYKDWPREGENRKTEIYYYEIKCDEKPDLNNVSYTADELAGHFCLRYIKLSDVISELLDNASKYPESRLIAEEMIEILKWYLN